MYFKRCRVLWDFTSKIRQNFEPFQRIEALDFGTGIHSGLEKYYTPATWGEKGLMRRNARQAFLDSIHDVQTKVRIGALEFEAQFEEQRKLGLGMLQNYFYWAPSHDNFTPIMVEIEFEVPIPGMCDVVYQGRIDMIVEDEYGYWLVDHKTTAQLAQTEWLALDDQCSSYAWAIKKQLGLEVRGVIYNELRKKAPHAPVVLKNGALSINKQQDTSYEVFLTTLNNLGYRTKPYKPYLDFLKGNPKEYVRRTKVNFNRKTLDIVEQRIRLEAAEMLGNPSIYPTPSRFNCNGCSFFRPCLALHEGADAQHILDEMYERRK
jgi:hypothetical protein